MEIIKSLFAGNPRFWVALLYHDIWRLRDKIQKKGRTRFKALLYKAYWQSYGSFVGLGAEFEDVPVFPHGPVGIFISNSAHIGKNCVIFHQVTIGSNMIKGSKGYGAPTLEDNIYRLWSKDYRERPYWAQRPHRCQCCGGERCPCQQCYRATQC